MAEDIESEPVIWVDLEMTGLDPVDDLILEVGFRLTNWDGSEEYARFERMILTPGWHERLSLGDNRPAFEIHQANGLTAALQELEELPPQRDGSLWTVWECEGLILDWLAEHKVPTGLSLAGSSNHLDRYFLKRHMPSVANHFGYRVLDMSAIREAMRISNPELEEHYQQWKSTQPADGHRPQKCLDASIAQWQWFLDNYLHI